VRGRGDLQNICQVPVALPKELIERNRSTRYGVCFAPLGGSRLRGTPSRAVRELVPVVEWGSDGLSGGFVSGVSGAQSRF